MRENTYQAGLIRRMERRFPGSIIIKNDPSYRQGILDLTILGNRWWAMLECKASSRAPERPNQRYYVDLFNSMSFASFIYPENEEEVLDDLEQTFSSGRPARFLKC